MIVEALGRVQGGFPNAVGGKIPVTPALSPAHGLDEEHVIENLATG